MLRTVPPARYCLAIFAAVAGLAIMAVPIQKALGDGRSTSVTVVNPGTSPALTSSVDDPGRIAYQSFQNPRCEPTLCALEYSPVPSGHRLVIQQISASIGLTSPPTLMEVFLGSLNPEQLLHFFVPFAGQNSSWIQPILFYVDGGTPFAIEVVASGTTIDPTIRNTVTVSGYLLDCTVSPCAPIAGFPP